MGISRGLLLLASLSAISACGDSNTDTTTGTSVEGPTPASVPLSARQNPRYDSVEGDVYLYIGDISEQDRADGKALGSVVSYRYFGVNSDGLHELGTLADDGTLLHKSQCADRCVIIKGRRGERLPFNPNSVIGAAFEDAINGHLKVSKLAGSSPAKPTPPDSSDYPQYVSTVPKAFLGHWDELIADKCAAREARFFFGKREFANFEVKWEVTGVKLYSPTEMDLSTSMTDDTGGQVDEIWEFKLVDGGKSLTGRKASPAFFKRCPI